jgi:tRNA(Ile2) C34 agmatinyltransferase TiaS
VKTALAMALLAATAAAPQGSPEQPVCPRCDTRVYRAGTNQWFCGKCGKVVTPWTGY